MPTLPEEDRRRTWAHLMRNFGTTSLLKADIRAAVDATDTWIENNQASFNSALPQPFRGTATLVQKTLVFCFVAMRRAGVLRAEEDS